MFKLVTCAQVKSRDPPRNSILDRWYIQSFTVLNLVYTSSNSVFFTFSHAFWTKQQNLWLRHRQLCKVKDKTKHFVCKVVCNEPLIISLHSFQLSFKTWVWWSSLPFPQIFPDTWAQWRKNHLPKLLPWASPRDGGVWLTGTKCSHQSLGEGSQHEATSMLCVELQPSSSSSSLAQAWCITAAQSCRTPLLLCFRGREDFQNS